VAKQKQPEKRRTLVIIGAIVIVAIILWLLLRRAPDGTSIVEKAAGNLFGPGSVEGSSFGDLPVSYSQGDYNYQGGSKGCVLCYSGYQRMEVVTMAPLPVYNPPPVPAIIEYVEKKPLYQYSDIQWNFGGNTLNMSR
jgi:hypothetical protein